PAQHEAFVQHTLKRVNAERARRGIAPVKLRTEMVPTFRVAAEEYYFSPAYNADHLWSQDSKSVCWTLGEEIFFDRVDERKLDPAVREIALGYYFDTRPGAVGPNEVSRQFVEAIGLYY